MGENEGKLVILGEGENCESALVSAALNILCAQVPQERRVITLSLDGCCGNDKDISNAESVLSDGIRQGIVNPNHIRKKVIVMDYDKMEKRNPKRYGQAEVQLRAAAEQHGYELRMQRPNLEYTIYAMLTSPKEAANISDAKRYIPLINIEISKLNIKLRQQFGPAAVQIPQYGKRRDMAERCLTELFNFFPEFIGRLATSDMDVDECHYSGIPGLIRDIEDYI